MSVTGDVTIATNCWIIPFSHPTEGSSVFFSLRNLTIETASAGISANGAGFAGGQAYVSHGYGPGGGETGTPGGSSGAGAGHGGIGGTVTAYDKANGGGIYGVTNAPVQPGSGGGAYKTGTKSGGQGGGLVRILARGTITVNGTITANGGSAGSNDGAGSGGAIYITCKTLAGTNGIIRANGANASGNGGGGGGGRIALWRGHDLYQGVVTAALGAGADGGETGTVVWIDMAPAVTNRPATNITLNSASLIGQLLSTGEAPATVYCSWGLTNGLDDKAQWTSNDYFGVKGIGTLTNNVVSLAPATTYYYRFYATNDHGDFWATPSMSFSTQGGPTVDTSDGATNVLQSSVTLRGDVTAGNPSPLTYFCWGHC